MEEIKLMTVKQLKDACKKYDYIIVRFPSGHKIGINTKVSDIALKKKSYNDLAKTSFVSYYPCDLNMYISYKHSFLTKPNKE